ncbi:MAG: hypothetical protein WCQ77_08515 [Planctomycetota bacterium]
MLDAAMWGKEPFGYHLTSVPLHVVNVLLVWTVIRQITSPAASLSSVLATLVFALHPVVTEAVCEPTYREDLLVATFSLAALVLAMRHDAADTTLDRWRALGCVVCCLLAIASKESGIVAPLLIGV